MKNMSGSKTVTRTFTLRRELFEEMEKKASDKGISTSTLMNQTLLACKYLLWPTESTNSITIARETIQFFINKIDDNEISDIGRSMAKNLIGRNLLIIGLDKKLETLIDLLKNSYGTYSHWFKFDYKKNNKNHSIVLTHNLGNKWSIFLENYFKAFFNEMLDLGLKSKYNENTVIFEFLY